MGDEDWGHQESWEIRGGWELSNMVVRPRGRTKRILVRPFDHVIL